MNLIIQLIIIAVLVFIVILIISLLNQKTCPKYKKKMPIFRIPKNFHQAMLGGWTCPNCGIKIKAWK